FVTRRRVPAGYDGCAAVSVFALAVSPLAVFRPVVFLPKKEARPVCEEGGGSAARPVAARSRKANPADAMRCRISISVEPGSRMKFSRRLLKSRDEGMRAPLHLHVCFPGEC